jgi:hypothetical protein
LTNAATGAASINLLKTTPMVAAGVRPSASCFTAARG